MNNNSFIYFNEDPIQVNGYIKFAVLPRTIDGLRESGYDPRTVFSSISALNSLLVTSYEGRDHDTRYKLHTPYGVFPFKVSDDGGDFLLLGFNESSFQDTNSSLMYGLRFAGSGGTVITIRLRAYDWFEAFSNGRSYDASDFNGSNGNNAIMLIRECCYRSRNNNTEAQADDVFENNPRLTKLLDLAESYSILSNELENRIAEETGQISYNGYESVDYPRHDRVAYKFCIDKQKKPVFGIGTNVDIIGPDGETSFTAEIVDVKSKKKKDYLTMLFTKELDIFERLRKGTAKARYFNSVFGENNPSGFNNEDLGVLVDELNKKEYPPNDSQVSAIKNGINSKDVYLVMGPPGTGKTTVILEWVKYFVKEKHLRVLVSSQNNKAVDNVLERLAEEKGIDTIRIGSEAKVQEEVIPYIFENKILSLRSHISQTTSATIEEVEVAINDWSLYLHSIRKHLNLLNEMESAKAEADKYVESYIKPFKKNLMELQAQNVSVTTKINKAEQANVKYQEYRQKYDSMNRFLQLLLYLPMLFVWRKLDKYNESITELVERQNTIANTYNDYYSKLKKNYGLFNEGPLARYYVAYDSVFNNVDRRLNNSFPQNIPSNPSFYKIRKLTDEELLNTEIVKPYCEHIISEDDKAKKLRDIVSSWKDEISGSQNYALNQIILDSVDLVGATCIGVSSQKRFQDLDFDVTIIDEAGQIQIHNALVPMSVSNKLIMLGDHMQIPPNADQELVSLCDANDVDPEMLGKSLFEQMYYDLPDSNKTLLDTQYRMPAEIADIISDWFYDSEYQSPKFLRNKPPAIPSISDKNLLLVNTPQLKDRVYENKDPEGGYNNMVEAFAIKKIVEHILSHTDFNERQIGIISAYKSQVRLIQNELKGTVSPEAVGEIVASLDSFQGQERDIIIYSFTRSSHKKATKSRIGFLNELRRLNVAMSRCKKILIMIGDYNYLSHCKKDDADHVIYAKDGKRIVNGSEAVFSEFIRMMYRMTQDGNGEIIDVPNLIKRIEG